MNVLRLNRVALTAIGRHKLRTFLSMLGVAIGVGAVVSSYGLASSDERLMIRL